jgi:hypothetical protein
MLPITAEGNECIFLISQKVTFATYQSSSLVDALIGNRLKNFSRQHMEIILLGSFARLCRTLVLRHLVTTATEKENLMNAWLISFLCQQLMKLVELSARVLDAVWSTHYITC